MSEKRCRTRITTRAGSAYRLAVSRSPECGPRYRRWALSKEVHCMLNAQGLDVDDEFRFALRFAWGRARMWLRVQRDAIKDLLSV